LARVCGYRGSGVRSNLIRQAGEKGANLGGTENVRMTLSVKENEAPNPEIA